MEEILPCQALHYTSEERRGEERGGEKEQIKRHIDSQQFFGTDQTVLSIANGGYKKLALNVWSGLVRSLFFQGLSDKGSKHSEIKFKKNKICEAFLTRTFICHHRGLCFFVLDKHRTILFSILYSHDKSFTGSDAALRGLCFPSFLLIL